MKWFSSLIAFLSQLLNFGQWFTSRKDVREEKANKTQSVKTHEKNSSDIDKQFPSP